jgi:hypothetical protein
MRCARARVVPAPEASFAWLADNAGLVQTPIFREMAMLRTFVLASALLGMAFAAHAEPELRRVSEGPASKTAVAPDKHSKAEMAPRLGAGEGATRTVRVGDVDVAIPLLKGYRDLAEQPDTYRGMFERMIPDSMVLLDIHIHESLDGIDIHDLSSFAQYEIYVAKALASRRLQPKEWTEFRDAVAARLETVDMSQWLKNSETRLNAALGEYGVDAMRIDEVRSGTPAVYRTDDRSLRLVLTVSNQQTIEGKVYRIEEVRASANLFVKGKIVNIVASREYRAGSTKPLEVMAALDAYVDQVFALNP